MFLFCWAAFLFISLLASVFPVSLPLIFLFLRHRLIHARMSNWGRTHFLAFMEWADDGGSRPAACSNVPVQSSSCSLRAFYRTFVVGKDTYYAPLVIIMMLICVFFTGVECSGYSAASFYRPIPRNVSFIQYTPVIFLMNKICVNQFT